MTPTADMMKIIMRCKACNNALTDWECTMSDVTDWMCYYCLGNCEVEYDYIEDKTFQHEDLEFEGSILSLFDKNIKNI